MFQFIRRGRFFASCVLIGVILSFFFWGMGAYIHSPPQESPVVSFSGHVLTRDQVAALVAEQRASYQLSHSPYGELPPSPHFVRTTVNRYIDETLLQDQWLHGKMVVSDGWLRHKIMSMAVFRDSRGVFSVKQYDHFLAQRGLKRYFFENELRRIILLQALEGAMSQSAILSTEVTQRMLLSSLQTRLVSRIAFVTKKYLSRAVVTQAEEQAYYAAHPDAFSTPAAVKVHYILLSPEAYGRSLVVTKQPIQQYYHAHVQDFSMPEKRRVAHILFFVAQQVSAHEESVVRLQAMAVLSQLQKRPQRFAALARRYSADDLSKNIAGDLGWVHKGELEGALDQFAFSVQRPDHTYRGLSLIKTRFGYHIVKVTGVRPAHVSPLAAVRHTIEIFLRQQKIDADYPALITAFSDLVEDHPKSLAPIAQHFHLAVHLSPWIVAGSRPPDVIFSQQKVQGGIFAAEFVAGLTNTPVIEIGHHQVLAAQVADFRPRHLLPFSAVQTRIHIILRHEKASALAKADAHNVGQSRTNKWSTPMTVSRTHTHFPQKDLEAIFAVNAQHGPAYSTPVEHPEGYVVYRVSSVAIPTQLPQQKKVEALLQLGMAQYRQYDVLSLVQYWRTHAKLTMDEKMILSR